MRNAKRKSTDIYDIIAANIKRARKKANLTQAELADITEYSHEFIRRIEAPNVKKYFSIYILVQIAKALNVKMADLFILSKRIQSLISLITRRYPCGYCRPMIASLQL